eukprot:SAG22_NODE_6320_length_870_cov_1.844358_1_plen_166_part_10
MLRCADGRTDGRTDGPVSVVELLDPLVRADPVREVACVGLPAVPLQPSKRRLRCFCGSRLKLLAERPPCGFSLAQLHLKHVQPPPVGEPLLLGIQLILLPATAAVLAASRAQLGFLPLLTSLAAAAAATALVCAAARVGLASQQEGPCLIATVIYERSGTARKGRE